MRPIDADALRRELLEIWHEYRTDTTANDGVWIALEIAKNSATVAAEPEWVSVKDGGLPKRSERWERYIVAVLRSHYPTSSYDPCDSPYDEEFVATALYDSEQKIWHLDYDRQLNALIDIEDATLNGDFVTHWMPLPEPPKEARENDG